MFFSALYYISSWEARTTRLTARLNSFGSSRSCFAASMFAGEFMFGSQSIDSTETSTASTPKIGLQRCNQCSRRFPGKKDLTHLLILLVIV